jgi:hypothetical protein
VILPPGLGWYRDKIRPEANRSLGRLTQALSCARSFAGLQADLAAKRVELLRELVPSAAGVALLVNPTNPYTESEARAVHDAARSLGLQEYTVPRSDHSRRLLAAKSCHWLTIKFPAIGKLCEASHISRPKKT